MSISYFLSNISYFSSSSYGHGLEEGFIEAKVERAELPYQNERKQSPYSKGGLVIVKPTHKTEDPAIISEF